MAQEFEQLLKDVFGESFNRFSQFQSEQLGRVTAKLQELAREAVKEELTRMHTEIAELRSRLTVLEEERARTAAESIESAV